MFCPINIFTEIKYFRLSPRLISFYYVSKNETEREGDKKANSKNQPPGLVQKRNVRNLCVSPLRKCFAGAVFLPFSK
jgi:hypothetical protein